MQPSRSARSWGRLHFLRAAGEKDSRRRGGERAGIIGNVDQGARRRATIKRWWGCSVQGAGRMLRGKIPWAWVSALLLGAGTVCAQSDYVVRPASKAPALPKRTEKPLEKPLERPIEQKPIQQRPL